MLSEQQQQLIRDYRPLALSIAKKFTTLDQDEARAQAMYALVVAADQCDLTRPFGPYARSIITNELSRMYREVCRAVPTVDFQSVEYQPHEDYLSSDAYGNGPGAVYMHLIDLAAQDCYDQFEMIVFLKSYFNTLDPLKKALFKLRMEELDQEECAKRMTQQGYQMSQPTVNRRLREMRKEFELQFHGMQ